MNLIAIAFGGALGALSRYGVYQLFPVADPHKFPLGTLCVNVLGSFMIGVFYVLILEKLMISHEWRPVITVGFLGAFTTFSTFALEATLLMQNGEWMKTVLYVVFSVFFCIFASLIAILLTRMI